MYQAKMSQIAGMNMHYIHHSFDYFLDSMERLGFKNIEIFACSPHFLYLDKENRESDAKKMGAKIKERGLNVVCITPEQCAYPVNLAAREDFISKTSFDYFEWYIRNCRSFGTDRILVISGYGYYDEPVSEGWKRSVDAVQRLSRVADTEDVKILFELSLPCEVNLVYDLPTTIQFFKDVAYDKMECLVDTVPVCYNGEKLADYFEAFGDKLTHIHLVDGDPVGHSTWGDGTQSLKEHIDAVNQAVYKGYLTVELENMTYRPDPEAPYKQALPLLREHLINDVEMGA